jgi:hypothetical protein
MMTKEQFNLWKHEPVTKWFFNYLINKRAFLKSAALEMWLNDPKVLNETLRGQIIELEEIADLPWDAIESFYKEREQIDGAEPQGSVG